MDAPSYLRHASQAQDRQLKNVLPLLQMAELADNNNQDIALVRHPERARA